MTVVERIRHHGSALREAGALLTSVIPGDGSTSPTAFLYLPIVGAGVGAVTGTIWKHACADRGPSTAAAIATAADALLTGALHLDGLADTADGLLAHAPQKSRLDIMSEPAIGTFGHAALTLALLLRSAGLSSLQPSPVLLGTHGMGSRALMLIATARLPYARQRGLVTPFIKEGTSQRSAIVVGVTALAGGALINLRTMGVGGFLGYLAGTAAGVGVLGLAKRRIGGYTGDVLGAAGVVFEAVAIVVTAQTARR